MKKQYSLLTISMGILIVILILGVAAKHAPGLRKIKEQSSLPPAARNVNEDVAQTKGGESQSRDNPDSGPVSALPWEKDPTFLEAQQSHQGGICLAAFRTVLPDPLPGEEENVHLAARMLSGTVVSPGQVFSQNAGIGPYTEARGFQAGPTYVGAQMITTTGGGVCKIASTLYNVAVLSDLQIVERHAHSMPVPYVPYGQDATVSYGTKDLKFKNTTDFPILIWAQGIDNILYIAFYGQSQAPKVEWQHDFIKRYESRTIYKTNAGIAQGDQRVAMEGMDGGQVRSWVKVYSDNSHWTVKPMGLSEYAPLPRIVEKGGMSPALSEGDKK